MANINIVKLIPLAGPDRLLRIAFILNHEHYNVDEKVDEEYSAISLIINGILLQKHSCTAIIDKDEFYSLIATGLNKSLFCGKIRMEILIRKSKPCEIELNYYSEELELARKFFEIDSFYTINKHADPEEYPRDFRLIDLREGTEQSKQVIDVVINKV